jgi:hypothetical protein
MLVYFVDTWSISLPFDILYYQLVYSVVIWYIFPRFGILYQKIWQPCYTLTISTAIHYGRLSVECQFFVATNEGSNSCPDRSVQFHCKIDLRKIGKCNLKKKQFTASPRKGKEVSFILKKCDSWLEMGQLKDGMFKTFL